MSKKVYDFWAKWCGPCKQLKPVIEELRDELGFELVEIDVDEDEDDLASQYNVRNIPTIIVVNDDMEEIVRHVGGASKDAMEKFFKTSLFD